MLFSCKKKKLYFLFKQTFMIELKTMLKLTSDFMPRAKEATAATIKMINVVSRHASKRNLYKIR